MTFNHLKSNANAYDPESEFAKQFNCRIISNETINNGLAPFNLKWIECDNLFPSVFMHATCMTRCQNPRTQSFLSLRKYRIQPIEAIYSFEARRNSKIFVMTKRLIRGCRCVLRWREKHYSRRWPARTS
uniref:uncharacterized protein LOC120337101 n=1 Tax=Styela clava TaxID=7725 RepID=UPI0019394DFD|nr:uncharacterized protein LOC120337101 [Styela clava]